MVVHGFYPLDPRVRREARAAAAAGYQVSVVSLRNAGEPKHELVDGVRVYRLAVRGRVRAILSRSALEYLSFTLRASWRVLRLRLGTSMDILHVHAPPDFLVAAGLVPKLLGTRLILDIHDLSPHMYEVRFRERHHPRDVNAIVWLLTILERLACRLSDHVVTVHGPYRDELQRHGVPGSKITVVMNSADDSLIQSIGRPSDIDAGRDGFAIAYHGTVTWWYGVDLLVGALALVRESIPNVRAVIVGGGDALAPVQQLAAELRLSDRIAFSGRHLPMEEALARVAQADCGVVPNRSSTLNHFALSSKLFDYVALGIPVVVARLETLARHFSEDEATFFTSDDAESLAEALLWVATHPVEARNKAGRASDRYQQYSWPRNRQRYLEVLAALA